MLWFAPTITRMEYSSTLKTGLMMAGSTLAVFLLLRRRQAKEAAALLTAAKLPKELRKKLDQGRAITHTHTHTQADMPHKPSPLDIAILLILLDSKIQFRNYFIKFENCKSKCSSSSDEFTNLQL